MKLILAFIRLIRWPNLIFIAITQYLFYHFIAGNINPSLLEDSSCLIYLLLAASVSIAAAGYIINDYFDLQIDNINKPERVVVDAVIKRRWAIIWHWLLSATGLFLSALISHRIHNWQLFIGNVFCVVALWFYSTTFKKQLLTGNIIISLLTAWTIIVVILFSGVHLFSMKGWDNAGYTFDVKRLFKFTVLYAGFAFIVTLIREVVKDLEDMDGDARYGCRTMPIAWGVPATKVFVAVWIIISIAGLGIIQFYSLQTGNLIVSFYLLAAIIVPLAFVLKKLRKATLPSDYAQISGNMKWIMLAGILSMLSFLFI